MSPTASALTLCAADRYASSSSGDTPRTSELLSKPLLELSGGSSSAGSTSSPSRSRTALAYSVRLRRRSVGRPGFGSAASSRDTSDAANASSVAASGRGIPVGGIAPARSLRTTFSQTSVPARTFVRSAVSSASPPVFRRSLWQVTQYRSTTGRKSAGEPGDEGVGTALPDAAPSSVHGASTNASVIVAPRNSLDMSLLGRPDARRKL